MLNSCYVNGDAGYCPFVERTSGGGIETVRTAAFNAAGRDVAGIDFGFRYGFSTDSLGDFQFAWDTTYTQHDKTQSSPTGSWSDDVGIYQGATNWEYRSVFTTERT